MFLCGITNGIGLGLTCTSNSSTWILTTTTCTSIGSMPNKDILQEIVANLTPPFICDGSSVVITISLLQELTTAYVVYMGENLWKTSTCTLTNLVLN